MPAVLDTHAAIWYLLDTKNLSQAVFSLIDTAAASGVPTYISAVSLVEVVYLVERGRIASDAFDRFDRELGQNNPAFKIFPLDYNVARAMREIPRHVVPDMPDRIIAATALHLNLPLVTRDHRLQAAGIQIIWYSRSLNSSALFVRKRDSRVRHTLKCERIAWVSKCQHSGHFESRVPHPCAVCKGAVLGINEQDRFLRLLYKRN
jgi:PIN domain nuclease of toxin-antitoxin system